MIVCFPSPFNRINSRDGWASTCAMTNGGVFVGAETISGIVVEATLIWVAASVESLLAEVCGVLLSQSCL